MRHLLLVSSLLLLAACSEAPTDPTALGAEPSFARAPTTVDVVFVAVCPANISRMQMQISWTGLPGPTDSLRFHLVPTGGGGGNIFTGVTVSGKEKKAGEGIINLTVDPGLEVELIGVEIVRKNGTSTPFDDWTDNGPFSHPGCPLP